MADRNTSVTVLVGVNKHPFHLEEQQLCACSPIFRAMLTDGFKETHERVVLLPEVDVETFQVLDGWISNLKLSELKDWE
jgi:BTB/POZ domain